MITYRYGAGIPETKGTRWRISNKPNSNRNTKNQCKNILQHCLMKRTCGIVYFYISSFLRAPLDIIHSHSPALYSRRMKNNNPYFICCWHLIVAHTDVCTETWWKHRTILTGILKSNDKTRNSTSRPGSWVMKVPDSNDLGVGKISDCGRRSFM